MAVQVILQFSERFWGEDTEFFGCCHEGKVNVLFQNLEPINKAPMLAASLRQSEVPSSGAAVEGLKQQASQVQ